MSAQSVTPPWAKLTRQKKGFCPVNRRNRRSDGHTCKNPSGTCPKGSRHKVDLSATDVAGADKPAVMPLVRINAAATARSAEPGWLAPEPTYRPVAESVHASC